MLNSNARRSLAVLPVLLSAVALAACAPASADGAKGGAPNDAAATRFVSCLIEEGQTAKILEGGGVGLLLPGAPQDGAHGGALPLPEGPGAGTVTMFNDEDGTWVVSSTAEGYAEEGGQRDAWATCEEKIPEFTQPEPDMAGRNDAQSFGSSDDQIEASLAFAACARENGYADFPDPDADGMFDLPVGITEDELRGLFEACSDSLNGIAPALTQSSLESLDFDWFLLVSEFFEGGGMVGSIGGDR